MAPQQQSEDASNAAPSRESPPSRFAGHRAKIIALLVSFFSTLLIAEVAVRKFFPEELDTNLLRKQYREFSIGPLIEPADDPEQLYQLKSGINEVWMNTIVLTGESTPSRISSFYPPPASPAIRIAMIGDSSSFGYRVFYECSYAAVLRVQLEDSLGAPVELRNYSAPGYNSIQERVMLEHVLAEWDPDLVILHYDHNDPNPQSAAPPGFISPDFGDNFLRSKLIKFAMRRVREWRNENARIFSEEDGSGSVLYSGNRAGGALYDRHLKELDRMGRLLKQHNIPAVAVIFEHGIGLAADPETDGHFTTLHAGLVPRLEAAGFHVLDLFPEYQRLMRENAWPRLMPFHVAPPDTHPNARAHDFIARHLHNFILDQPGLRKELAGLASAASDRELDREMHRAAAAYQRALVLIELEKFEEAGQLLAEAMPHQPRDAGLRFHLAAVYIKLGDVAKAATQLEEVLRLKPDFATAHLQLSQLYIYAGKTDLAMNHHALVLSLPISQELKTQASNEIARVLAEVAGNYARAGDTVSAAKPAAKAVELYRSTNQQENAARLEIQLRTWQTAEPSP